MNKRKWLEYGGIASGVVLIAFGIGAVAMSVNGHNTVVNSLKAEQITSEATTGMNPTAIAADAKAAGVPSSISLPTCSVEGKNITSSSRARCFAQYMRIHALEASGGLTYSQMGRYAAKDGSSAGTNDPNAAVTDAKTGRPIANAARDTWVTETALSTALNVSYMADNLALFGIVVGIALLLSGIGFMILAILALGGEAKTKEAEAEVARPVVAVTS
jgi:hypothetical protein